MCNWHKSLTKLGLLYVLCAPWSCIVRSLDSFSQSWSVVVGIHGLDLAANWVGSWDSGVARDFFCDCHVNATWTRLVMVGLLISPPSWWTLDKDFDHIICLLTCIPCPFNDMCLHTVCLDSCEDVNILHETLRPVKDGWLCHTKQWEHLRMYLCVNIGY